MRKKKLLWTIVACVVIAVLVLPAVTSILNSREATIAPNPEPATGATLTSDGGGPGSKLTEVVSTESTAGAVYPSLAVDSSGNVHVAWEDLTNYGGDADNQFDIFYKRYVVGSGWTTTEVVSRESTAGAEYPSLAVDSSGTVHVAWHDLTNYGGDTDGRNDVFYKRYVPGGGWSATEVVSTESTAGAEYPSLAVDSSGNVHVAWEDWTNYGGDTDDLPDIFYKRYVVGSGWITTEVVSTETTFYAHWPSLAADSKGNIHIAWEDMTNYGGDIDYHYDIFYKRYVVGVGWSATEVVSTESTFGAEHPSLSVDSSGNVHVAWKDFTNYGGDTDNQYDIFYNRYVVGSGWSATEVVSTESTASAYSPTLAVDSSGNIHVAWHDYTNYGGDIDTLPDIFYKWFKPALPAEPTSLMDIVRFPGAAHRKDLYEATYPPDWSTLTATEILSKESTANAHSPSLAVDSSGNVHVAWTDLTNYGGDTDNQYDIFYNRYVVGSGWSATEVVSTESTAGAWSPSLAVDSSGNVHVAWEDPTNYGSDTDGLPDIFYKRYVPGSGWSTTEVVSTESTGPAYYPSLAVDSSGNVHVAWEDFTNYGGDTDNQYDIFYKRYVPGSGWSVTEVVSTESTADAWYPSLAVDFKGNIHVAWEDLTNYGVFYKRYVPGSGWSVTEVVSTESTAGAWSPSLAVDSSGNVHVAWEDLTNYGGDTDNHHDIFYKRYVVGSGWSVTEVVSTESNDHARYPSLAVDSSGNVHVAWEDLTNYGGDSDGALDVFYKRYVVGSGWSTTEVVSRESTAGAEHPSLAVDLSGNIHIAWQDLTNYGGDTDNQYDIFYKRSGPDKYYWLTKLTANLEGLKEVRAELESKGFIFAVAASNVSRVDGGLNRTAFSGTVLSWWSSNMDRAGRMAFIVAAMMDDGQGLVFGAVTNLIPPEILLLANQYVIVNAMPYTSVEWFYYDAVNNRIAKWSYWWYDSQYQPDWFWNIYWKWRNYINEYYGWNTYLPWWWWFWHYIYDKQWHNWAAESPH